MKLTNKHDFYSFSDEVEANTILKKYNAGEYNIDNNKKISYKITETEYERPVITYTDKLSKTQIQEFIPEFDNDIQLFFDTYYTRVIPYDKISYPYFLEFINILK